ncbi:mechanosensitive ion channel family protein, partial [Spirosoma sp.]|uniref:mechanosensitive ion channel family protein n=1 Tax=Spirosoma sp. TaxID=1899569 RepID=UPI003B3BCA49
TWRTTLSKSNNDLQGLLDQVLGLSSDSLLMVASNDTTEKQLYRDQLVSLKFQLQDAGTRTSAKLDTVSRLLADVSGTVLTVNTLQASINERLRKSAETTFQKEAPYIWEAPAKLTFFDEYNLLKSTYQGQDQILRYFFTATWDNRLLLLIFVGAFFIWVFTNFKKARTPSLREKIGLLRFDSIKPIPTLSSLIVLLTITPLFEPQSPTLYIEIIQFLLFLVLTFHLWNRLIPQEKQLWAASGVMYVLLLLTNPIVSDGILLRLWLIALDLGFLYLGYVFAQRLPRTPVSRRLIRPVSRLYMVLLVLSILLNVFGRISLAKTFGVTAVIGLIQITGLGVFIEVVMEALELQIKLSAGSQGIFSRVNVKHIRWSFKRGLAFLAIVIWLLVFFINLGISDAVYNFLYQVLTRPRSFGSLSFTLSSLLSFSVIIYLASLLQKNIGVFFGESQLPVTDGENAQVSSVLALVRLVVIVVGVLLAVAASGISVDKFTVVLGALSVGIGLGMQTIVTNFISGIILIFEKPFRIGDYIELADKKGRIRDIGIRSSKMITVQGSEVIIPNGDLLSNRLVNWTSGDAYLKTEFSLKVSMDTDLDTVRDIIKEEVKQLDGSLQSMSPDILVTSLGGDTVELKVQVWIQSIYSEAGIKSQLLQRLVVRFKEAGIKLM